jgi:hypothetical protein
MNAGRLTVMGGYDRITMINFKRKREKPMP